jgi:hypothetical protein
MRSDVIDLRLFTFLAFPVDITPRASLTFVTEGASIPKIEDTIAEKFTCRDGSICSRFFAGGPVFAGLNNTFINIDFTIYTIITDFACAGIVVEGCVIYVQNLTTCSTILTRIGI